MKISKLRFLQWARLSIVEFNRIRTGGYKNKKLSATLSRVIFVLLEYKGAHLSCVMFRTVFGALCSLLKENK